jgi:hypothetical protein
MPKQKMLIIAYFNASSAIADGTVACSYMGLPCTAMTLHDAQ